MAPLSAILKVLALFLFFDANKLNHSAFYYYKVFFVELWNNIVSTIFNRIFNSEVELTGLVVSRPFLWQFVILIKSLFFDILKLAWDLDLFSLSWGIFHVCRYYILCWLTLLVLVSLHCFTFLRRHFNFLLTVLIIFKNVNV